MDFEVKVTIHEEGTVTKWDFSLIYELDELLKWFASWENLGVARSWVTIYHTYQSPSFSGKQMYIKDKAGITGVCLKKLVNGYVYQDDNGITINMNTGEKSIETRYGITFEGLLFIETDKSYANHYAEKNQARNHAEQVEKAMQVNNKWTKVGTVVAGISTSILVLIEVVKMSYDIKSQSAMLIEISSVLFVFLFGIGAGLIIHLLIRGQIEKKE
jgi:hypothetical protein